MIRALVDFALNNKFVVIAIALLLMGWGAISFHNLPGRSLPRHRRQLCDGYKPKWPGKRSAEEIEQQVTISDRNPNGRNPAS